MTRNALLRVAGLALATLASALPSVRAQDTAWVWVNPAGQGNSWTPGGNYRYSSTGGPVTITRSPTSPNAYTVEFDGFTDGTGVMLASAYGGNHTVVIGGWGLNGTGLSTTVRTFDSSGGPAIDAPFTLTYRIEGGARSAYLWADQPAAASYTPSPTYSWNDTRPDPTIVRSGPGEYTVRLEGLAPLGSESGHVQVATYGTAARRTKVRGWNAIGNDMLVLVRTMDMSGAPADARFTLSYVERAAPIDAEQGSGAHVWANNATASSYTPSADYTDSNGHEGPSGAERIRRVGTGNYLVDLPDVAPSSSSTVQVSGYGTDDSYASIANWADNGCGGTRVRVRTYDPSGAAADARFTLQYLTNRPADQREVAWAWVSPFGQGQSFTPLASYSFAPGGAVTVDRLPGTQNEFVVRFPGIDVAGGSVLATAYGGNHTAVVESWYAFGNETRVTIALYTPNGAAANDRAFTVQYRRGGNVTLEEAYLWHDSPLSPVHTPNATFSWNADRGAPSIVRNQAGVYAVTLPGLGQGSPGGHVQVSPYGSIMRRANVTTWFQSGNDLIVNVRVRNAAGALADGSFVLVYNRDAAPIGERVGSGAHLWANLATPGAPYVPAAAYRDSNSIAGPAGSPLVTRTAVGQYLVELPDVAPSQSTTVQVTAYGTSANHASVNNWTSNGLGGTNVYVRTYDSSGAAADSRFNLSYLSNRPAVPLGDAANSTYGSGCNGLVLQADTLPYSCGRWELDVSNFPVGSLFGFVQLDLAQANAPIGVPAPGCTVLTGGAVTSLFVDLTSPTDYVLQIPDGAVFLGVDVFAQGGAWVPGINPINVVLSNGVRGTVGNN